MKRQRGRNRKPGQGGGGGGGGHNPNRAFESNGPDGVKIRGNAQHVYERYQQLARDAFASGDRVLAENYLQHAEHYFRVLRSIQPQRPVAEIAARDAFASGYDIDFEDEGQEGVELEGVAETAEAEGEQVQAHGGREDRGERRDDRGERRDGEFRRDRDRDRGERRDDRREGRGEGRGQERREGGEARAEGEGREGGRRESRRERFERRREGRDDRRERAQAEGVDPLAVVEPQGAPLTPASDESSPVLRAQDGAESHMPAFLRQAAPAAAEGEPEAPAEKPKRTRRKRPETFDQSEGEGNPQGSPAEEEA